MKIIVAITGASGAVYARLTLERLLAAGEVGQIALIYSDTARQVVEYEGESMPADPRITVYDNGDLFAPPASGSAAFDAMIVVPASVGTLGRVASGAAHTLIERAADVMLKERRRLVFVVRETPLSPASPSFYSHPDNIGQLCMTVVERALTQAGITLPHYEWSGR